ncbi:hypothetical protein LCGC14_0270800 [marine sediment metagenome]|uniref:Uncharacterized protein n=1 Tax=marine sediment metagenome TaxID=412755 RepID=A0A0F9WJN8_9ZZZZ
MTISRSIGLSVTVALTFAGSAALAQKTSPALKEALAPLVASGGSISDFADFDQDGEIEAIVTYADDCGPGGCLFSIVDLDADGIYGEVAYQYGQAPTVVSGGTVIDANGVFWTWSGQSLLPYYDFFDTLEFYAGTSAEQAAIMKLEPWRPVLRNYDIQMANVDLLGDGTPERFAWLDGSEYKVGQASPYYVFSDTGEILMQGNYIDRPYLFRLQDRNATALITQTGSGFSTTILE